MAKKRKQYTDAQRAQITREVQAHVDAGRSTSSILKRMKVAPAAYYAWLRKPKAGTNIVPLPELAIKGVPHNEPMVHDPTHVAMRENGYLLNRVAELAREIEILRLRGHIAQS